MKAAREALAFAIRSAESRLYMLPAPARRSERELLIAELKRYRVGLEDAAAAPALPRYEECGCCGCYHRPGFIGFCRADSECFTADELDEFHGHNGWIADDIKDSE